MESNRLVILWLSADKRAAAEMALSYARDSLLHGWWDEVELLLWGPPVRTAAQDEAVIREISLCQSVGMTVSACLDCAVLSHTADILRGSGIRVRGLGDELTSLLKSGAPLLII